MIGDDQDSEQRCVLTDDEVIALAIRINQTWPSALPTVDTSDLAAVEAAAERGTRSLVVRDLLGVRGIDELATSLARIVDGVFTGRPALATYLADQSYRYVAAGFASAHFAIDDDMWLTEVTVPTGVHYLRMVPSEVCRESALTLLRSSFEHGLSQTANGGDRLLPLFQCAAGAPLGARTPIALSRSAELIAGWAVGDEIQVVGHLVRPEDAMQHVLS